MEINIRLKLLLQLWTDIIGQRKGEVGTVETDSWHDTCTYIKIILCELNNK